MGEQKGTPILALESGGTKLVAALADGRGRLLERRVERREPQQRAPQTLAQLEDMGRRLLGRRPVAAVGFGFGGTVDRTTGRPALCFHEEGWEEVDARGALEAAFAAPVFIENDCSVAALAEAVIGWGVTRGTFFYATIGTGIGSGVVHDGRLLQLGAAGEGEIGHIQVVPDGPPCGCGLTGCLETLCSGPGLDNLAERLGGPRRGAAALLQAWARQEPQALRIVNQAADYLGAVLATVLNLLAPEMIVLGGGVLQANEAYLRLIERAARQRAFPPFVHSRLRFERCALQTDVVCQGAALYAAQCLGNT